MGYIGRLVGDFALPEEPKDEDEPLDGRIHWGAIEARLTQDSAMDIYAGEAEKL